MFVIPGTKYSVLQGRYIFIDRIAEWQCFVTTDHDNQITKS